LIHKARENLQLAETLSGWAEADAAANRLYYSLYHACWEFLVKRGCSVPDNAGSRYFRHEQLETFLEDEGFAIRLGLDADWETRLECLRSLRVKADYYPDHVRTEELRDDLFRFVKTVIAGVHDYR
jgi:uncharacterized protein (UPF0332 family)